MNKESKKVTVISILAGAVFVALWTSVASAISNNLQGFFSAISHTSSWVVGLAAVIVTAGLQAKVLVHI